MKKILSLDGGGSWALIQILTLKERYGNIPGHEILKDFDIVIANSGGSIVLAALVANWTPEKCLTIFDDKDFRTSIFSKNKLRKKYFPTGLTNLFNVGPRYSTSKKYKAFNNIFKELKNKSLHTIPAFVGKDSLKIIICTFDSLNKRARFFKSYSYTKGKEKDSMDIIKAIHGSSNAPVNYFDFPAKVKSNEMGKFFYLWDGALGGFNNPLAAGIIEAIKLGIDVKDLFVVSLGTANKVPSMEEREEYYQLYHAVFRNRKINPLKSLKFFFENVMNLSKTILYEPPDWSTYVSYIMKFSGSQDHETNLKSFIRMSPLLYCDDFSDKDETYKQFLSEIIKLDMDAVSDKDVQLIKDCFNYWKEGKLYNQAIKSDFDKKHCLELEVGHKKFSDAMKDWMEEGEKMPIA